MMRQLFELKDMVAAWDGLAQRVEDGLELLALAEAEGDVETEQAIAVDAEEIAAQLEAAQICAGLERPARPRRSDPGHPRGRRRY